MRNSPIRIVDQKMQERQGDNVSTVTPKPYIENCSESS